MVTAIAVVVLVGAVFAFAALWIRTVRGQRALAKRFAARYVALQQVYTRPTLVSHMGGGASCAR